MEVNDEFFKKHKDKKTDMKVFLGGGSTTTMLSGCINSYDKTSFVLGECLIQIDKLISITPKQ